MTNFIELFEKRFTVLSNLRKLRSVASAPKTSRLVLEKLEPRRLLAVSAVDQIAAVVNNAEETAFVASPLTEQAPIDLSNVQDDGFATQEPLSSELLETETYVPETDCFNQTVTINNEEYVPFTMLPVRPVSFDNLYCDYDSEQGSFSYLGSVPDGLNSGGGSGVTFSNVLKL